MVGESSHESLHLTTFYIMLHICQQCTVLYLKHGLVLPSLIWSNNLLVVAGQNIVTNALERLALERRPQVLEVIMKLL